MPDNTQNAFQPVQQTPQRTSVQDMVGEQAPAPSARQSGAQGAPQQPAPPAQNGAMGDGAPGQGAQPATQPQSFAQDPFGQLRQQAQQRATEHEQRMQQAAQQAQQQTQELGGSQPQDDTIEEQAFEYGARVEQDAPPAPAQQEASVEEQVDEARQAVADAEAAGATPEQIAELKDELASLQDIAPIARYVQNNPQLANEFYGLVEQHMQGGGAQQEQNTAPEPPTEPERPVDYNEEEAYVPGTNSFRYRQEMEEYHRAQLRHQNEVLQQQVEGLQGKIEQQEQQTAQQRQLTQMQQNAMAQYDMQPQDAANFVQWAQQQPLTMDRLHQLYQLEQGVQPNSQPNTPANTAPQATPPAQRAPRPQANAAPQQPQAPQQQQQQAPPRRRQPLDVPVPSAAQGGASTPQRSVEDRVFDTMLQSDPTRQAFQPAQGFGAPTGPQQQPFQG